MGKKKKIPVKQRIWKWAVKTCAKIGLALILFTALQVLAFRFIPPPGTVNMVYEWARGKYFDAPYVKPAYGWKSIEKISPHLRRAVLASEDQRFLKHNGFDFTEIKNVIRDLISRGRFRGASTITMQAARSLFLPSSRSLARKLAEAWYTVLMELMWDKKRILEIYLNTVDWGTGIVGAQAGARAYFSCDAGQLTPSQAATMAAVLPSPHKWSAKRPGPYVQKRRGRIIKQMKNMPLL